VNRRLAALLLALAGLLVVSPAQALAGPIYDLRTYWAPTNLPPGGEAQFVLQARNIGDAAGAEDLTISEQLPAGLTVKAIRFLTPQPQDLAPSQCSGVGTEAAQCTLTAAQLATLAPPPGLEKQEGTRDPYPPGYLPTMYVLAEVPPSAAGTATSTATLTGGSSPQPVSQQRQVPFSSTPAPFGVVPGSFFADFFDAELPFGAPLRQAGAHPYELRVDFDFNEKLETIKGEAVNLPVGKIKTVEATLPRGFIGNPEATPKCDPVDFAEIGTTENSTACPADTQVGYLNVNLVEANKHQGARLSRVAIYNLEPPKGVPADLAFNAQSLVQAHIYPNIDPAHEYAIKSLVPNIANVLPVTGSRATFWGVPGDPAHDKFRAFAHGVGDQALGAPWGSAPIRPFFTNPSDCGEENGGARIRLESYQEPGVFTPVQEYGDHLNVSGCEDPRFRFEPDISLQPTSRDASGPTGLDVHLEVPLRNDEVSDAKQLYEQNGNLKAIATPPIKRSVVTLPEGMTISPSAAQGLATCSSEQISLGTDAPVSCPDASQYGTLTIHTPILPDDHQPEGFLYVAAQQDNPFHSFLALYLVIEEPERGILVKIAGRADLDPKSGQIKTTFDDLPQFPVSDLQLSLKGGVRAALVNPTTCGTKTITAEFFSWQDPSTPHPVKSSYEVTHKADGSPCVNNLSERPFKPQMQAGSLNNTAGAFSPFLFRLTRTDDDQEFSQLGVTLPQGLSAKHAGVTECPQAAVVAAIARDGEGEGALEQIFPSCPASSLIGTTQVGAGVGVPLTFVPGNVYLAGPYRGEPLSMVVITPAVVGPYDLGVIAVQSALHVDLQTAQVTVKSDPFPQIFQGIPVRIRDIRVKTDRPQFTLNPTSCEEKQIRAHVTGTGGDMASTADDTGADLSNRFQAADCASLEFKPRLFFRLFGGTHRGAHPKFRAILKGRPGDANIGRASVALPRSEFLDQGHIRTVCTRVQFAADQCPAGSVYGFAEAKTPLLDKPLSGPVYLRSSSHELPDLVVSLGGQIEIELAGRVDSVNGGIRNTFEVVPDAPVSEFTLTMQGGKKGLLVNSTNLCAQTHRAIAKFTAQSGRRITLRPKMQSACGKAQRKKRRH